MTCKNLFALHLSTTKTFEPLINVDRLGYGSLLIGDLLYDVASIVVVLGASHWPINCVGRRGSMRGGEFRTFKGVLGDLNGGRRFKDLFNHSSHRGTLYKNMTITVHHGKNEVVLIKFNTSREL